MIYPILKYPDERLKEVSSSVPGLTLQASDMSDPRYKDYEAGQLLMTINTGDLAENLLETMYATHGVGLAAIQIGVAWRVLVMDVDYDEVQVEGSDVILIENKDPRVFINPIIHGGKGDFSFKEGCLSVPGVNEFVSRYKQVDVSWFDEKGKPHRETFGATDDQQLLSVCIQHEMDHLDGKLFIDRLSGLKKDLLRKKMLKKAETV